MWSLSEAATKQLRQSHTMTARVDVLHSGRPVATLVPIAGDINSEATRPVMRNMLCTLADPTGELSSGDLGDLLSPYNCELAPYRGVLTVSGVEWAPLGIFGLTTRGVPGNGQISVAGQDRAIIFQGPMADPLAISGNTPVEAAIATLLSTRRSGLQMQTWKTGFTCGPLLFPPDTDVWGAALDLAKSVGGWLYHDRRGLLVFGPTLPVSRVPVRRWAYGDGLLLSVDRSEDSDSVHNVVVVESAKTATGGTIRAIARDNDPTSPTFAGGSSSTRRPITIVNQHIGTIEQAKQVAATELVRALGRSETASFTVVVDPTVDPLDVVTLHHPASQLINRAMVIETTTVPLVADASMPIGTRKSIITQDGQVLEDTAQVTTA